MALPPIQTTLPLDSARRHRAELLETMHAVEHALAAPAADPGWRPAVSARLTALRTEFAEHMRLTEGPEGLYAELLEHSPRLAYRVRTLVREHATLAMGIDAVCSRVGSAAPDDMRGWA